MAGKKQRSDRTAPLVFVNRIGMQETMMESGELRRKMRQQGKISCEVNRGVLLRFRESDEDTL